MYVESIKCVYHKKRMHSPINSKTVDCFFIPYNVVMTIDVQVHSWGAQLREASSPPANKRIPDFMVASQSVHPTFFWAVCLSRQPQACSIVH